MTAISKWLLCGLVLVPLTLVISRAGHNDGESRQRVANADGKRAAEKPHDVAAGSANVAAVPMDEHLTAAAELVRQVDEKIRRGLQTEVTLEFLDTPLSEAVKKVAARGEIPVVIDETSLAEEGIAVDEPVSGSFKKLAAEQVIDRLLKPFALVWTIESEVLLITTSIEAESRPIRRVYDVKRLLESNEKGQPIDRAETDNPSRVVFSFSDDATTGDWLVEALKEHSAGPWESIDGTGGTIDLIGDRLVVHQTQQMQNEVAGILAVFELSIGGQLTNGKKAARRPGYSFPVDLSIRQALLKKTSVKFLETPLTSVLAALEKAIGHAIILQETPLAEEGIPTDEAVSLELEGISVQSVLTLILKPLGCTYYVEEGAVWITTSFAADENLFVTVYDVRDVLKTGTRSTSLVEFVRKETSGLWKDTDGGDGTIGLPLPGMLVCRQTHKVHAEIALSLHRMRKLLAEVPTAEHAPQPDPNRVVVRFYPTIDRERALDLEKAIVSFVAPETWKSESGGATIHVVGETLVIGNRAAVHTQIRKFLDNLREAEDSDKGDSRPSRRTGGGSPPF